MKRTLSGLAALVFAALSTLPALAGGASPLGRWQVTTGEARYAVTSCAGGLCAKLVWLRKDAMKDNKQFLDTYLVQGARQVGDSKWQGEVRAKGQKLSGTITQTSENRISLRGCLMLVFCKSFTLKRYEKK